MRVEIGRKDEDWLRKKAVASQAQSAAAKAERKVRDESVPREVRRAAQAE